MELLEQVEMEKIVVKGTLEAPSSVQTVIKLELFLGCV
jgi:hypothetical protein